MELYILRHGIAEDARGGMSDAERALTDQGRKRLKEVLRTAAKAKVRPSLVLTSPLLRAAETADLAARELGCDQKPVRTDALAPESSPEKIWQEIRKHKESDALLLAGHEPLLSQSIAYLLGAPSLELDFKKGALARIDVDRMTGEPKGTLKWLLVPKLAE